MRHQHGGDARIEMAGASVERDGELIGRPGGGQAQYRLQQAVARLAQAERQRQRRRRKNRGGWVWRRAGT